MIKERITGFDMPKEKVFPNLVLKKLTVENAQVDFDAVKQNAVLIRRLIEVDWPGEDFNFEANKADIVRHEREFEEGKSFTFGVWDTARQNYLGCLYFYLEEEPWFKDVPKDSDAVVEFWVTQEAYDQGLFTDLFNNVRTWMKEELPFKNPHFNMKEIPA